MRSASRARGLVLSALLAMLAIAMPLPCFAQSVEVIVNDTVSSQRLLSRDLLRAIFTMQLRAWPDGRPVRVFVLPDNNPISDRFYRQQLGLYPYVLRATWDRMVFTGTGLAPTIVQSEQEMRERVRSIPGAIGYVGGNDSAAWFIGRRI
jgi:ABC-type phosphate transport system substrate-binding protein